MSAGRKGLVIAGGIAALIIIVGIIAALLFNINSYRSNIETAASEATGLNVRIMGKMGLSFVPFGISAKNVRVTSGSEEILSLESIKIGAKFMPLLKRRLEVTRCELIKPVVTIVRTAEGKYNFEGREKKSTEGPAMAFTVKGLKLSDGTVSYLDRKTGTKTELRGITLATDAVSIGGTSGEVFNNISFTGSFDCKEVLREGLKIMGNLKAPVKAGRGVYSFTPLTMEVFGGNGEGDVAADISGADAVYKITVKVSKLDFEKLEASFGAGKVIGGKGYLAADLTIREKRGRTVVRNVDGTFALGGDSLVSYTMDLDKVLSTYEASQKFHLIDIGAYFIVGPLGAVALKGYRYGNLYYQSQGGQGAITRFASHWKIKDGSAEAADCALATRHNRIALRGRLNLVSERYDNVVVALLDEKGCPQFAQSISGPFGSPRIGTVSAVESLAGPFLNLYRKAKRFVQADKCEVFYRGSVEQPR